MDERNELVGRVAVVTGGNSGIGLGVAQALAARGASVVVAGRTATANDQAVATIAAAGGRAIGMACDVAQEVQVVALVQQAVEVYGRIDIAVASAGGIGAGTAPLVQMDSAMWRSVLGLNLDSVFFLYREAARQMIAQGGGGSLIGISSVAAVRAMNSIHYAAAKGGVNALTTTLAGQLGPKGIRVNVILPGMIETPATAHVLTSEEAKAGFMRRIPLGRVGQPHDIAQLVCYLASERSSFITGQQFIVDGGMTVT